MCYEIYLPESESINSTLGAFFFGGGDFSEE